MWWAFHAEAFYGMESRPPFFCQRTGYRNRGAGYCQPGMPDKFSRTGLSKRDPESFQREAA